MWLADELGRDASLAFNESVTMRLKGRLDAAALHGALQDLLDRHGALRANLGPEGDTLCVLDCVQLALPTFDYSKLDDAEREAAVARSEEHTSELQSLMRISYAVFCLTNK